MFSRTFLLFFIMTVHVNIYSLTPQSCQELWSFSLLVIAILTAVRYMVKTILICIFLMKKDIKHLNTYLWSISFSSFEDSVQFDRTLEGSVFETGTLYLSLLSQNLVHRPGCPEAHAVLLASAFWLLGLELCASAKALCLFLVPEAPPRQALAYSVLSTQKFLDMPPVKSKRLGDYDLGILLLWVENKS